jgi:RNA polymerase sigma-70 factor (ECF subfamily)
MASFFKQVRNGEGGRHHMAAIPMVNKNRTSSRTADPVSPRHESAHGARTSRRPRTGRLPARREVRHERAAAPPTDPKRDLAGCYVAHSPIVQRYVSRICGSELSHDVTQDVFTAFWHSTAEFDPERGSLQSLLLTIGHRRAIDVSRQNQSRIRRDHRYATDVPGDAGDEIDSAILRDELVDEVTNALSRLRPALREPIRIAFFEDCTYHEVAARLGLPEGTVKSRIRTGFSQLRALLGDYAA